MRYADVHKGQRVLYNRHRLSSKDYSAADGKMAEVLATGLRHEYRVQTGGWDFRYETRETRQGVRLRIQGADGNSYELVTIAAHLTPAEGKNLEIWQRARDREMEREAQDRAEKAMDYALAARFEALGITAEIKGGSATLSRDETWKVLDLLEREAQV